MIQSHIHAPVTTSAKLPVVLLLALALLSGCSQQSVSQDKYAGDAYILEPGNFVDADFAGHNGGTARGEVILLSGKVVNEAGKAMPGAIVYIHQTDAQGRYRDRAEREGRLDPHFQYEGWIRADEYGEFTLRTIAPGPYVNSDTMVPHIHIQARHGEIRSYYKSLNFPQYPPRNGDMSYVDRTDKWGIVINLEESPRPEEKYTGAFELVVF